MAELREAASAVRDHGGGCDDDDDYTEQAAKERGKNREDLENVQRRSQPARPTQPAGGPDERKFPPR